MSQQEDGQGRLADEVNMLPVSSDTEFCIECTPPSMLVGWCEGGSALIKLGSGPVLPMFIGQDRPFCLLDAQVPVRMQAECPGTYFCYQVVPTVVEDDEWGAWEPI